MNFKSSIFLSCIIFIAFDSAFASTMPPAQLPAMSVAPAQRPPKHPGQCQRKILKDSTAIYTNFKTKKTQDEKKGVESEDTKLTQVALKPKPLTIVIPDAELTDDIPKANPESVLRKTSMLLSIKILELDSESLMEEEKETVKNINVEDIFCEAHNAYIQLKAQDSRKADDLWTLFDGNNRKLCDFICNRYVTAIEGLSVESELLTCEEIEKIPLLGFFSNFSKEQKRFDNNKNHPWTKIIEHLAPLRKFNTTNFAKCVEVIVMPFLDADDINKAFAQEIDVIFKNLNLVIERIEKNIHAQPSKEMVAVFAEVTNAYDELNKILKYANPIFENKRAAYKQLAQKLKKEAAAIASVAPAK